MKDLTDDAVLARSLVSPEALGLLYERHAAAVFRFLVRRVGNQAAEDLLGDVFVAAFEARARYRSRGNCSALPWLYGISGNIVRSYLRRQRPSALIDPDVGVDWDAVDERLDARASRAELRLALDALTPPEREAFLLVGWEGLSNTEAARALGVTPIVIRTRLSRARQRARTVLTTPPVPAI